MDIVDEQQILDRLRELCEPGSAGKSSLRIYREQFRRMFLQRYGRDRITPFLDFEYIEDFDSVVTTIKKLMDMSQREVLFIMFLQFDYNRDGLLTNSDLIELFTYASTNTLLEKDLLQLLSYIKSQKLKDRRSNSELFVTDLNYQALKLATD